MNKLAIITAFLGGVRNRYMVYHPDRELEGKLEMASRVAGCAGVELCYPADFADPAETRSLLDRFGLGVSAINFRSRRTGKWMRGSFTSEIASERQEVVEDMKRAMDLAAELGCYRITTCPLNEGVDVPFEADFEKMYDYAAETLSAVCAHNPDVKVCLEYKKNDPRAQVIFGTAGETASFCQWTRIDNLGATFDIGHSLLARENPAQAAVLLAKTNRLFYVHLNDNDGVWDWDMIPGTYHLWEFVELFYTLRKLDYDDDWFAFDVFSKEIDQLETFNTVMAITRKLEEITDRLDVVKVEKLLAERNPAKSVQYLYSLI
jgi:xylose isomerase